MISLRKVARWFLFRGRTHRVYILYKSGNKLTIRCKELEWEKLINRSALKEVTIEAALPAFAMIGVDNIEALWFD